MSHNHQISMAGGTLSGIITSIQAEDVAATCILSAIGAVVSYFVSVGLRRYYSNRDAP
jgi:hypothetical protein